MKRPLAIAALLVASTCVQTKADITVKTFEDQASAFIITGDIKKSDLEFMKAKEAIAADPANVDLLAFARGSYVERLRRR